MHPDPQQHTRERNLPIQNRPQNRRNQHPQQPLRTPPCTNIRNHRIQKPHAGILHRPPRSHPILHAQTSRYQPPGQHIRERKEELSERERAGDGPRPGRGHEQPGEERRVAVRVSRVGRLAAGDEAGGVGEDEVVNVGVFDGGVGVLPGAVEEEGEAEGEREGED